MKTLMKRALAVLGAASLSLGLAACADHSNDGGSAGGDGPQLIYLTNDPIGVNKFLESGRTGVQKAAERFNGSAKIYEGSDETSMRQNMEAAVQEQPDYIVTITFDFTDMTKEFAEKYPDQKFILIDDCPSDGHPENMFCAVFREHEASYLLGYEAGLLTESDVVGTVGAVDIPFIHRYTDAFQQGAQDANDKLKNIQLFIGGQNPFSDPARAKEQAASLTSQGADYMFAVASGSNGGVFEAAEAGGAQAFGVDVNQCPDVPGSVADGTLKLMDILIPDLVGKIQDGTAEPINSYGLKEGGMDIISLHEGAADSQCTVMDHPEVVSKLEEIKQEIIDGKITPVDATGTYN